MHCEKCGTKVEKEQEICQNCGAKAQGDREVALIDSSVEEPIE